MAIFSARHKLHLVPPQLYDGAVETMDHFIDGSTPLSFARQTSFDSSFAFLLLRFFIIAEGPDVTCAWWKRLPS